jgi:hypothetical protein
VDHARDDVFAGAALPLNEHGDVRARDLGQSFAQSLHDIGAPEHDASGGISPRGWISELTGFECS